MIERHSAGKNDCSEQGALVLHVQVFVKQAAERKHCCSPSKCRSRALRRRNVPNSFRLPRLRSLFTAAGALSIPVLLAAAMKDRQQGQCLKGERRASTAPPSEHAQPRDCVWASISSGSCFLFSFFVVAGESLIFYRV